MAAVGFETYARILEEAVAELKGEPIRFERDPEISVDVPAFLPDDYVPDTGQRLDFYRRLAQAGTRTKSARWGLNSKIATGPCQTRPDCWLK